MQKCPQCHHPLLDKVGDTCPRYGGPIKRARIGRPRILTIVLVTLALCLAAAQLFAPERLALLVGKWMGRQPSRPSAMVGTSPSSGTGFQDIYQNFLDQYAVRPDERIVRAFDVAASLYRKHLEADESVGIGEIRVEDNTLTVPVIRGGATVKEIRLPVSMAFTDALGALGQCLRELGKDNARNAFPSPRGTYWLDQYRTAIQSFHMVDPRQIIEGLLELEDLRRSEGPDARLVLAAAQGYALLSLGIYPDHMQVTDAFAVRALAFLALARHMDPQLHSGIEESLIAMTMGYTAHADRLLSPGRLDAAEPTDRALAAFMRKDLAGLESVKGEGSRVLGYYLLARLYRIMGLYREAAAVANELFGRFSGHYPTAVEIIRSADLGIAKQMTILYPLDILGRLEHRISPSKFKDVKAWMARFRVMAGDQSVDADTSFGEFEKLLSRWQPLESGKTQGFFIGETHIKAIYRALYAGAIHLRFKVLLNRWGVIEKAEAFVDALSGDGEDNTLVRLMRAQTLVKRGQRQAAAALCRRILKAPDTRSTLAMEAFYLSGGHLSRISLAPAVAGKLDGRPFNLTRLRYVLQRVYNYDQARKCYLLALKHDPYRFVNYNRLATVTGSDAPFTSALKSYPDNVSLIEDAGDHYSQSTDRAMKEKGLEYYDRALAILPSRQYLWEQKARTLRDLGRNREAAGVLETWIRRYGRDDLDTTLIRGSLARRYLDLNEPDRALEVLAEEVDSYQAGVMKNLAKAYERLGRPDEAEAMYRKAMGRYPTTSHILSAAAAFMWRHGKDAEAAALIGKGRRLNGSESMWYFDDCLNAFSGEPDGRIMDALDKLVETGAGPWEIRSLAFRFQHEGRSDTAFRILNRAPAGSHMQGLEKSVAVYKLVRNWRGEAEAGKWLAPYMAPRLDGPMTMVLFQEGLFDPILTGISDPDEYSDRYREFMWLMKLLAWIAKGEPLEYRDEITRHYDGRASDYYHTIGRYMLGAIPRADLLRLAKTPKQLCEFSYYIGFSERMKGHFAEAANWYQICLETGLSNNGEFHWAAREMFWWSHMGIENRHRHMADDIRAYHAGRIK